MSFLILLTIAMVVFQLWDRIKNFYINFVYRKDSSLFHRINSLRADLANYQSMPGQNKFTWFQKLSHAIKSFVTTVWSFVTGFFLNPFVFLSIMLLIDIQFVLGRLIRLKSQLLPFLGTLPGGAYFWLSFYALIVFNISLVFTYSLYCRFTKPAKLPQIALIEVPNTAIAFTIRGEGSGLFERMAYTLRSNFLPNVDLWVLSGDAKEKYVQYEIAVVARLKSIFGENRVHYFHTTNSKIKKAQMIELWLNGPGASYKYFVICDADSMLPANVVLKFLRYAEHPANANVSIFQSSLRGIGSGTFYSSWQANGIQKIMSTEVPVNHRIFGTMLYVGHNALIRVVDFKQIKTPSDILSHDIWDSAYLDSCGKKIAFCNDIVSFEQTPNNFLEDIKRIGRWSRGNLQTIPLLFRRGLSTGIRFQIFYGIYTYLIQPIFVVWIALGLGHTNQQMWRGYSGLSAQQFSGFLMVLFILLFHQVVSVFNLSPKIFFKIIVSFLYSTVISINMILYNTINILQIPFSKVSWIPMKKDSSQSLSLEDTALALWPGTVLGFVLLSIAQFYPYWLVIASPLVFSLVFSIPVVYLTGRTKVEVKNNFNPRRA